MFMGAGGFTALAGPATSAYLYGAIPAFPALASSIVGTALPLLCLALAFKWLPETKGLLEPSAAGTAHANGDASSSTATSLLAPPSRRHLREQQNVDTSSIIAQAKGDESRLLSSGPLDSTSTTAGEAKTLRIIFKDPILQWVVIIRTIIGFNSFAMFQLLPLWSIAPISAGGLGYGQIDVGHLCAISSVGGLTFVLCSMVPLIERMGLRRSLYCGSLLSASGFALIPFVQASWGFGESMVVAAVFFSISSMGTATLTTAITNATNNMTRQETRGLVNGIATTVESFGKMCAPALTASMFAVSLLKFGDVSWGHGLVFWSLALSQCSIAVGAAYLPAELDSNKGATGPSKARSQSNNLVLGVDSSVDLSTIPQ
jgi:hypothetical protein